MRGESDPHSLQSWCSWTEGVPSLLPKTDVVVLGRGEQGGLIVPWRDVTRICSHHMQTTEEDPPRFRVDSFPAEEWQQLTDVGQKLA